MIIQKKYVLLLLVILLRSVTTGQNHFTFTSNTGKNMTILLQKKVIPSVNETPLSAGDEIGVFTPGGFCAGAVVWNGKNTAITVWGDNEQTSASDGFTPGENLLFRIWKRSDQIEVDARATFTSGGHGFSVDAIAILGTLNGVEKEGLEPQEEEMPIVEEAADGTSNNNRGNEDSKTVSVEKKVKRKTDASVELYDNNGNKKVITLTGKYGNDNIAVLAPNDSSVCYTDSVLLKWKYTGKGDPQKYQLEIAQDSLLEKNIIDTVVTNGANSLRLNSLTSGQYWWRIRPGFSSGWKKYSGIFFFTVTALEVFPGETDFRWSPAVAGDSVSTVSFRIPLQSEVVFTVSNMNGKLVEKTKEYMEPGYHEIAIETGKLSKGKYSYKLDTGNLKVSGVFEVKQ